MLDHVNNYVERLSIDDNVASCDIPTTLNVLHNYFDDSNKIIV